MDEKAVKAAASAMSGMDNPGPRWLEIARWGIMAYEAALAEAEPTDAMLDAGYDVSHPIDGAVSYGLVREIWKAMVRAMIAETHNTKKKPAARPETETAQEEG